VQENFDVKILMIDDDEEILEDIKRWLKRFGYKDELIYKALNPKDAKERHRDKHFDIVIVDMRMDSVDDSGFKFIEEQKKLSSIIIIFTANDSVVDCRKAFREHKVWDYLPKGRDIDDLNPFEVLHHSIQDGIREKVENGNSKDDYWISEHIEELIHKYNNRYIAVMDNEVIESADSENELKQKLKENERPTILPVILKVLG
jgi:DNA-binding NtrC family response regulator